MSGYQGVAIPPAAQQQMLQVAQTFPGTMLKGSVYEVPLQLPAGVITLSIRFPGNYPNQPPVMYVLNSVAHPLIGEDLMVNYPPPNQWNPAYSIFTIVRYVHNAFKQQPPMVRAVNQSGQPSRSLPSQPQASLPPQMQGPLRPQMPGSLPPQMPGSLPPQMPGSLPPQMPSSLPPQMPSSLPPQMPSSLPPQMPGSLPPQNKPASPARQIRQINAMEKLASYPPGQLGKLANPSDLEEFVNSFPEVRQLVEERDQLLRSNLKLAEDNLTKKPEIDGLALSHAQIEARLQEEKADLDLIMRQVQECENRVSKSAVLSELQMRSKKAEVQASAVFTDFKSERVNLEQFMQRFVELRTEKWKVEFVSKKLATVD